MDSTSSIKNYIGNILIGIGILLVLISVFFTLQWKLAQRKILESSDPVLQGISAGIYVDNQEETARLNAVELQQASAIDSEKSEVDLAYKNPEKEAQKEHKKISRENYMDGMMTLSIPKLSVRAGVVKDTSKNSLKKGPALYEISPLPDEEGGNVSIAGHRNTYGAWFRRVDELVPGDDIILEFNGLKYLYKVEKVFIVEKDDWSVTKLTGYNAITLTSCHPARADQQRIIVRGKLEKIVEEVK